MDEKIPDVIVVGGGLAGLTAAAYLARGGKGVTLYEKASTVGGRARTQEYEGFRFNMGPHGLYLGGTARKILRDFGIVPTGGKPKASGYAYYEGQLHPFPVDPVNFIKSELLNRRARLELLRFFGGALLLKPSSVAGVTLKEWLESRFKEPVSRAFVNMLARTLTYTNAPEYQSAGEFISQLHIYAKGNALYMDGGWQTLVDGMRAAALKMGVQIAIGEGVEALHFEGRLHQVRLRDGEVVEAGAVVVATDPATASKLIEGGEHMAVKGWAASAMPVRGACLNLGLRRLPKPDKLIALGLDCPLYLSVHSAYAKLAPGGGAVLHLIKYLHPDSDTDPKEDERELEALMDLMQPGWREEVVTRQYMPRLAVTNAVVQAAHAGFAGRPGPQVPDIPNLYVAGDWVGGQGSLLDASLSSARRASELVLSVPSPSTHYIFPKMSDMRREYQTVGR